jgi:hypothetical protein
MNIWLKRRNQSSKINRLKVTYLNGKVDYSVLLLSPPVSFMAMGSLAAFLTHRLTGSFPRFIWKSCQKHLNASTRQVTGIRYDSQPGAKLHSWTKLLFSSIEFAMACQISRIFCQSTSLWILPPNTSSWTHRPKTYAMCNTGARAANLNQNLQPLNSARLLVLWCVSVPGIWWIRPTAYSPHCIFAPYRFGWFAPKPCGRCTPPPPRRDRFAPKAKARDW